MIIGLCGFAGSGKSEVARVLIEEFGFERVKFGDGLKNMLRALLTTAGYDAGLIERYIEGDLKESVIPALGVTSRQAQIDIGENARRDWGADVWADIASQRLRLNDFDHVVLDDVRRPNEADAVRKLGGELWRVTRPGIVSNGHETERHADNLSPDNVIQNAHGLADLREAVRAMVMAAVSCA
jgi:cytidylate kinase